MTKIVFYKQNGAFYGFRETGHTGFASAGHDVLCAALSAMTMLVINTLENSSVEGLNVKRNRYKVTGLMLLKLLEYILNTRGDVDITADRVLTEDGNRRAVGVMGRKHVHTLSREVDELNNVGKVGAEVVLRKHNALTLTGSTGGENEKSQSIGVDRSVEVGVGIFGKEPLTLREPFGIASSASD